jgi:VWFA-related protein
VNASRPLGTSLTLVAAGLIAAAPVAAQEAPAQQIRSIVDVVSVDVSVTGDGGKPVVGLTAGDFVITVDGRPRRITSAQYVAAVSDAQPTPSATATYSTNAASGRLIMLLVDLSALRGRASLEAASRFVSQLSPADRVGLIAFPGTGAQIDFTRDHASIRAALSRLSGQAESIQTNFRIDLADALAAQRGDLLAINALADRECAGLRLDEVAFCRNAVVTDATALATYTRQRTQNTLTALRTLTDRFADTPASKTLVLMSEGLLIDRLSDLAWLGPGAARGQLTIHAVQVEAVGIEVSSAREASRPGNDRALGREGLTLVASATKGEVFPAAGGLDNAFVRLSQTLSGYYLLGFEPESIDRDGAPHKIKVDVPGRPGTQVRARNEFSIGRVAAKTDEVLLTDLLQSPVVISDIGLKLAAFTMRDTASAKLRVLMALEIDRTANPDGRLALAFALTDEKGQVLGSRLDPDVKGAIRPTDKVQPYSNFILSEAAGPLVLRVAVVDEQGRQGSVEHRFSASLTTVGEFQVGDLLIADERPNGEPSTPKISGEFTSGIVNGYLELYSDSADSLKNATVIFEVAQSEQSRALDGAAAKVQPASADQPNRRALEGSVPTTLLAPGEYVIRAIISASGKRIGQLVRAFRVGRPVTVTKATAPTLTTTGRRDVVPFSSRTEKFDRTSVLTPQVVGFFMERMHFSRQGETNPGPAIEHARAGRFDEALQALSTRTGTVASAFLTGLALYSKGQLEPAAAKFREALRLDSEFFPAAFYLGSCYAAGNNDLQAIGAWHMSLVTQSDAPFIYTLLGDALLREKDAAQALEVLNEAAAQWPDNDEVQVRVGAALAMSGKRAEALLKYEPYLDSHPEDHERLFAAIRIVYEARNQGKPVRSTNEDRALFDKWASAYAAAKGPQQAIVDQWRRAFSR